MKAKKSNQINRRFLLNHLSFAVGMGLMMSIPSQANASDKNIGDLEIYQPAKEATVTLMMMMDISGSMGIESYESDYALKMNYTTGSTSVICAPGNIKTETMHGGAYTKKYCPVPVSQVNNSNHYRNRADHARYPTVAGAWVTDPNQGCDLVGNEYRCYDRISRLKDALYDTLMGNAAKGIAPLGDDKVIGLSTLGVYLHQPSQRASQTNPYPTPSDPYTSYSAPYFRDQGAIRVPARRLDEVVNGKTQRQILVEEMAKFEGLTATPTTRSYAESAAYLLGTTTIPAGAVRRELYQYAPREVITSGSRSYQGAIRFCDAWDSAGNCTGLALNGTRRDWLNNIDIKLGQPSRGINLGSAADTRYFFGYMLPGATGGALGRLNIGKDAQGNDVIVPYHAYDVGTGFIYSSTDSKKPDGSSYEAPSSFATQNQQCSGQGIYVLSDGAPSPRPSAEINIKAALGSHHGANFSCGNDWDCMYNLSQAMYDKTKNPQNMSFLTAMVGFGRNYLSVPASDNNLSIEENTRNIIGRNYNSSQTFSQNLLGRTTEQRSAVWGVRGGGGWYPGNSSQDIVTSINDVISKLTLSIPTSPAGTISIPRDPLAVNNIQPYAYLPMMEPKVESAATIWRGNLKKYHTLKGTLFGKDGTTRLYQRSTDATAENTNFPYALNPQAMDIWQNAPYVTASGNTDNSSIDAGGVRSKLNHPDTSNGNGRVRTVYVEVIDGTTKTLVNAGVNNNRLVNFDKLVGYSLTDKIHLLNFLGYKIDLNTVPTQPNPTPTQINAHLEGLLPTATFNQPNLGGVNHSVPVLAAYKGQYESNGRITSDESKREDYLLYGSMDGALHLVDAKDGAESFAFIPRAMFDDTTQRNALLVDSVHGGIGQPKFGVDAPWSIHATYGYDLNSTTPSTTANTMYAYGGLRMGGEGFYGLDITNRTDPKLLFSINSSSAGFGRMGQIWAKPTVATIKTGAGVKDVKEVLFFGGGYDMCYENPLFALNDSTNPNVNCQNKESAQGNAVYMVDAKDGSLLASWVGPSSTSSSSDDKQYMRHSIVGEITVLDRNNNGHVDHLYFGDLGGQMFRIDLQEGVAPSSATRRVVKVFDANEGVVGRTAAHRFYEKPIVSFYDVDNIRLGLINIASGDRSSPLNKHNDLANPDRIYGIFDRDLANSRLTNNATTTGNLLSRNITTANIIKLDSKDIETNQSHRLDLINKMKDNVRKPNDPSTRNTQGWYYDMIQFDGRINVPYLKSVGAGMVTGNVYYASIYSPEYNYNKADECSAKIMGGTERQMYCLPWGICADDTTGALSPDSKNGMLGYVKAGPGIQEIAVATVTNTPGKSGKAQVIIGTQTIAEGLAAKGGATNSTIDALKDSDGSSNLQSGAGTGSSLVGALLVGSNDYKLKVQRWYDLQNSENN